MKIEILLLIIGLITGITPFPWWDSDDSENQIETIERVNSTDLKNDINSVIEDVTKPEISDYNCENDFKIDPESNKFQQFFQKLLHCSGINIDSRFFSAKITLIGQYRKINPLSRYWSNSDKKVLKGYNFKTYATLNTPFLGNVSIDIDQTIGIRGDLGFKGSVKLGYLGDFFGEKRFHVENDLMVQMSYKKFEDEIEVIEDFSGSGEIDSKFGRLQLDSIPHQKVSLNGHISNL